MDSILPSSEIICALGPWCCFRLRTKATLKKVCDFGRENKQPPHFILPRLGRSSLLLSTLPALRFQRKAHIKHDTLGKSEAGKGDVGHMTKKGYSTDPRAI